MLTEKPFCFNPCFYFYDNFQTDLVFTRSKNTSLSLFNSKPNNNILDSSKLKEFADDYFRFDENGRKFPKCSLRAISPFPAVSSKELYCRHVKTRACLGKR